MSEPANCSETPRCGQCQAPLVPGTMEGLCPRCLAGDLLGMFAGPLEPASGTVQAPKQPAWASAIDAAKTLRPHFVPETKVIVRRGGAVLLERVLLPGQYTIGSGGEADIHVEEASLAELHALLTVNVTDIHVLPLHHEMPTLVNGARIANGTRIFPNQTLALGEEVTVELRRVRPTGKTDLALAPEMAAANELLPDEILHERRYDIGGTIAQGGMGQVLSAREAAIERRVAMKVMLAGHTERDVRRFVSEAKITGQLEHPGIVPVYELGVDAHGQVFYTMKYVAGVTLREVLDRLAAGDSGMVKRYPLPALLTVFQKACDAVAFAHARGVIHRDLKPDNIMLGDFGEVLVMDWGLAKLLHGTAAEDISRHTDHTSTLTGLTLAGQVIGTPQYMSPEQAAGETKTLDARSDIYSLGAILYTMLALRPAARGSDVGEVLGAVRAGTLKSLPERPGHPHLPDGRVPASLAAVVRKAMQLKPGDRYPGVPALQADITAYQNGFATGAEQAGLRTQLRLWVRRHRHETALFAVSVLALTGLAVWAFARIAGQKNIAEQSLASLKRAAPVYVARARDLAEEGKLDEALGSLAFALQLEPDNAGFELLRAQLLQASEQLPEAESSFQRVLALDPGNEAAAKNLALTAALRKDQGSASRLTTPLREKLFNALLAEKRQGQTAALTAALGRVPEPKAALLRSLKAFRAMAKWNDDRVQELTDGTYGVNFREFPVRDFSALKGHPVSKLDLSGTGVTDLSTLAGLPLRELTVYGGRCTGWEALRRMPLEFLSAMNSTLPSVEMLREAPLRQLRAAATPLDSIEALRGKPLTVLDVRGTRVASLEPLRGITTLTECLFADTRITDVSLLQACPSLTIVHAYNSPVADFSWLAGKPLTELRLTKTSFHDLTLLRRAPLQKLYLQGTTVEDAGLLLECSALTDLVIPRSARNIGQLRQLPNLRRISYTEDRYQAAALEAPEFWKAFEQEGPR